MNPAVIKLTVTDGRYFRAGDVVRTSHGQTLRVIAARAGTPRSWHTERRPLWMRVWWLLRYRYWPARDYYVITKWYRKNLIRVVRERPSPLPRRLP